MIVPGDVERALDDAFAEQVKLRFGILSANVAGGEPMASAAAKFQNGYRQLLSAYEAARAEIKKVPL